MSRGQKVGWWVVAPLVLTALCWKTVRFMPSVGVDGSWQVALDLAQVQHLHFGTQVIFTFGPLGFLHVPAVWRVDLGAISLLYTFSIRVAVAAALLAAARATFGSAVGVLITLVVLSVNAASGELVVGLGFAIWALREGVTGRGATWAAAGLGAVAGMQCLLKVSNGGAILIMAVILALSLPGGRARHLLAGGVGFLIALLAFWGLTDQSYGTLPQYIATAVPVVTGYSAAMQIVFPGLGWEVWAALLGLGVGLWATWETTATAGSRMRWGTTWLWIIVWFSAFKEGFVRQDPGHAQYFFSVLLAGLVALRWGQARRASAAIAVSALTVFALASQFASLTDELRPIRSARAFADNVRTFVDINRARAIQHQGYLSVRAQDPLDAPTLALLRGHTVAVAPAELVIAWAYGLHFDPLPVLQSYAAYTSRLDRINADFVRSSHAPERILFQGLPTIDGRVPAFDDGETLRAMFCRYRVLRSSPPNLVLGRATDRCSAPRPLVTVRARFGQTVTVPRPPPRSLVSVRISGLGGIGLSTLASLLYKPPLQYISLNSGPPARLIAATAGDGLPLLSDPSIDWPAPLTVAAHASTLAVLAHPRPGIGGGTVTLRFFSQSVG